MKQINSKPLHEGLAVIVSRIHRASSIFMAQKMADYAVGPGQHAFLLAMRDYPGMHQEDISRMLRIDKAYVTRALSQLEQRGLVQRTVDQRDKRAMCCRLTEPGQAAADEAALALESWQSKLEAALGDSSEHIHQALLNACITLEEAP